MAAKQGKSKKKGPKGKKARAKAKLDRQWGETAIVDDEKPRRVGKSRLLSRSGKSTKQEDRIAPKESEIIEGSHDNEPSDPRSSISAFSSGTIREPRLHYRNQRGSPDDSHDSSEDEEEENEPNAALSGLLTYIRKSNKKKRRQKKVMSDDDDDSDDGIDADETGDTDASHISQDSDDSSMSDANDDSDQSINSVDMDEEEDDDDSVDAKLEETNDSSVEADLFRRRFGRSPLQPPEMKMESLITSKVQFLSNVDVQVTRHEGSNDLEDLGFFGQGKIIRADEDALKKLSESSFESNRKVLQRQWKRVHRGKGSFTGPISENQAQIYPFLTRYADLLVPTQSRKNRAEMHSLYLLHILNHVMTTRSRIQRHNRKIKEEEKGEEKEAEEKGESKMRDDDDDRYRDQGFTRPTVLVLLPTRGTCHSFVENLCRLTGTDAEGPHMERFVAEYGANEEEEDEEDGSNDLKREQRRKAVLENKGKDWNELFGDEVNQDDDFKLGISITPKAAQTKKKKDKGSATNIQVKLYTDFYKSDIIVASPLGLKILLTPEEDGDGGNSDFLSSIEICLVQHADVLMMQNWDHANDVLSLLNQEPENNNDTDFSRVRKYALEGQSAYWRQFIISTDIIDPFLQSAFKRYSKSLSGSVRVRKKFMPENAALAKVLVPMKQVFQRIPSASFGQQSDARVNYFVKNILPPILRHKQKHTMIYIPSYFDFVSLRNVFLKKGIAFVSVHEYSRHTEVGRGRARFLQGRKPIMLYTGRCNFFHRHSIRGIRHLIFLGLPEHAQFYADQVNLIDTTATDPMDEDDDVMAAATSVASCLALFTKYEGHALDRIVGSANCSRMVKSDKSTFMFHS